MTLGPPQRMTGLALGRDPVLVTATTWVWRTTAVTPLTRECRPSG